MASGLSTISFYSDTTKGRQKSKGTGFLDDIETWADSSEEEVEIPEPVRSDDLKEYTFKGEKKRKADTQQFKHDNKIKLINHSSKERTFKFGKYPRIGKGS